jgi:hypothetical protein
MANPASNIIILDHSAESRRAMSLGLAMMGTPGVKLRNARGKLAAMWRYYRGAQINAGGGFSATMSGTPAGWRANVREAIAQVRAVEADINASLLKVAA